MQWVIVSYLVAVPYLCWRRSRSIEPADWLLAVAFAVAPITAFGILCVALATEGKP